MQPTSQCWSAWRESGFVTLQPNLFLAMWLACRWLSPFAITVAVSALIACTAATALAPRLAVESSAGIASAGLSQPPDADIAARSVLSQFVEPQGASMRVSCPGDPNHAADVRVDDVQALDIITEGNCEMRSLDPSD